MQKFPFDNSQIQLIHNFLYQTTSIMLPIFGAQCRILSFPNNFFCSFKFHKLQQIPKKQHSQYQNRWLSGGQDLSASHRPRTRNNHISCSISQIHLMQEPSYIKSRLRHQKQAKRKYAIKAHKSNCESNLEIYFLKQVQKIVYERTNFTFM